jgi:Zn-dependent protease with chaperone function
MDFFEHQEQAQKRTGRLIVLYVMAVVAVIGSVYLAMAVIFRVALAGHDAPGGQGAVSVARALWDPELFAAVAGLTTLVVLGGSGFKIASLASGGGSKVAEMLGGQPLSPLTTDPAERRLLNVVEEMALAAGTPVPPVYLMRDEPAINAFAAGFTPGDAVIGVTQGTVDNLSRDELQGVIAHEFSHILNGDMKLNIRLMGVVFGLLLIGLTGWFLLRISTQGRHRLGARDDKKGANPLPLIGLALYVIGYAGVFFGNLIKAAVSRQREYLADASAVQFTRNPEGLAGALKKIAALGAGSQLKTPRADEASHLFFGNALGLGPSQLFGLLATHPPLIERIKRLDPSFDGDLRSVASAADRAVAVTRRKPATLDDVPVIGPALGRRRFSPPGAVAAIGLIDPVEIGHAAGLRDQLSPALRDAAGDPLSASATIHALLLDRREPLRSEQWERLGQTVPGPVFGEVQRIASEVAALGADERLALAELAMPALRQMSPSQFDAFDGAVRTLIHADARVGLFEYTLYRTVVRNLAVHFGRLAPPRVRATRLEEVAGPLSLVLSKLAHAASETDPSAVSRAFEAGTAGLRERGLAVEFTRPEQVRVESLDGALAALAVASPRVKERALRACADAIAADGLATTEEVDLLRLVSESLDCPMPPLAGLRLDGRS